MKIHFILLEFWISCFILLYSFSTLSIETTSSWQVFQSIKALEIKTLWYLT